MSSVTESKTADGRFRNVSLIKVLGHGAASKSPIGEAV